MATGTLVLSVEKSFTASETQTIDMGALSYPNNGTYSRHKPSISSVTPTDWYLSWGNESSFTQYKWNNWDSDESHIHNNGYPNHAVLKVKNNTGTYSTQTITLTIEYTYVDSYSVSTSVSPSGSGTASVSAATASPGTTVTVTCTPSTGYSANTPTATGITFSSAGTNKWTFTMPSSNVSVSCTFSKISYSVTVAVSPSGSGTLTRDKATANYGDTVTLTRSAGTGYQFSSWSTTPNNLSINGSNQFTMPAQNVSVTANFTKINYTVSVAVSPSGSGTLTTNKATANYNDTVTLTPTPATGYRFSSWSTSPSGISINSSNQFTMPAQNVTITANFVKIDYSVTVSSNPAAGGTLTTNKATANYGDTVTLTKTAASGYHFSNWSTTPSNLSINGSNQFTMPAQNVSVTANWAKTMTAVTAGNKILATDRSQTGTTTTAGTVMQDSHFTAGTKIEASTFNSQVLGL